MKCKASDDELRRISHPKRDTVDRGQRAIERILTLTGMKSQFVGGGCYLMIGVDVLERLISIIDGAHATDTPDKLRGRKLSGINVARSMRTRTCDDCGRPFMLLRADARYCSDNCRKRAARKAGKDAQALQD